jgi:hypothetical protein
MPAPWGYSCRRPGSAAQGEADTTLRVQRGQGSTSARVSDPWGVDQCELVPLIGLTDMEAPTNIAEGCTTGSRPATAETE